MRALQDKLDHETAVKEEWERKVAELEEELSSLQKKYKDVVDDGRKKMGQEQGQAGSGGRPGHRGRVRRVETCVQALWRSRKSGRRAVSFMMAVQDLAAFSPAALSLYQKEEQRLSSSAPFGFRSCSSSRRARLEASSAVPSSSTTTTSSSSSGATATADEAALPSAEPAVQQRHPLRLGASAADTLGPDAQPPPQHRKQRKEQPRVLSGLAFLNWNLVVC